MPDDAENRAALDQVLSLVVLLNTDMTQALAKEGLTVSRATLLWSLLQRGPSTQRVLAGDLGVSARTITGLVDGLVATGFVTREPHPTDRRATLVTFTEHGETTMRAQQHAQGEFGRLLFGAMSRERFDCFTAGLSAVLETLHGLGLRHRPAVTT